LVFHTEERAQRFGVFENRVPMRIFRPKRKKEAGRWRILNNEELNNLTLEILLGRPNEGVDGWGI
jgi:hypothetical protein